MAGIGAEKPAILVLMDYYLPAFKAGGPVRSVSNLVEALGNEFNFRIITADRDIRDSAPFSGITPGRWATVGKAQVLYVNTTRPAALIRELMARHYDILYLNSFFSRLFSIVPILLKEFGLLGRTRLILAPRGEFAPGALAVKPLRKRCYIATARRLRVYKSVIWHVSSEFEANDVKQTLGREIHTVTVAPLGKVDTEQKAATIRLFVAGDLPTFNPPALQENVPEKMPGALRAVFVGRIARNKGVLDALQVLQGLGGKVAFDIYGPMEDSAYWTECQRAMDTLPSNVQVRYCGPLRHEEVQATMQQYHVLLFPTHGENYGHVIVEAMIAGCPVITSDRTPWRDLEQKRVGWDLPLTNSAQFEVVLQRCIDMGFAEYETLSRNARQFGIACSTDAEAVSRNRELLRLGLEYA